MAFILQAVLFILLVIWICIRLFKYSDRSSRYFLFGSLALIAGLLFNTTFESFIPTKMTSIFLDPNLSIPIGLVLEMCFFTMGVASETKTREEQFALQKLRIKELIIRSELNQKRQKTTAALQTQAESPAMSAFVKRALHIINHQIDNPHFSVSEFAQQMFLSRVQLHRRLKSELGMSASETVRWVRITYAATLFGTTDLNVTEVSHEAGFNNLSYFASCFRKQYGVNPSNYRRSSVPSHREAEL